MNIYQKEQFPLRLEIRNKSNELADLTGSTVRFRVAPRHLPHVLERTAVVVSQGLVEVVLEESELDLEAGHYEQEWRVFEADGTVTTAYRGSLDLKASLFGGVDE